MNCIDFNNSINEYLDNNLEDTELNRFLNHLRVCPQCSNELEISYIVYKGIRILDDNDADYNLSAAFRLLNHNQEFYIRLRKLTIRMKYIVTTILFWSLCVCTLLFIRILFFGV